MTRQQQHYSSYEMAVMAAQIAEAKKAVDTTLLDTADVSYLADYFVICSGESKSQVRTITDEVEKAFRQRGQQPLGVNRDKNLSWCVLDYGDIVIHVMNRSERDYYQLDHFWSHASVVPPQQWQTHRASQAS